MSGMSPSSALGSAISRRIVVSSVLILTDGIQEPCTYLELILLVPSLD